MLVLVKGYWLDDWGWGSVCSQSYWETWVHTDSAAGLPDTLWTCCCEVGEGQGGVDLWGRGSRYSG